MRTLEKEEYYDILSLDWEYRRKTRYYLCSRCGAKWLPKHIRDTVCPRCGVNDISLGVGEDEGQSRMTKSPKIQLPVMDNGGDAKQVPHYRLLYSNTDNAWAQKKTRDWVVVYAWFPEDGYREKNTYTVLTDGNGVRIIAGQPDPRDQETQGEEGREQADPAPKEVPQRVDLAEGLSALL